MSSDNRGERQKAASTRILDRLLTIPNGLSAVRLIGSLAMIPLVLAEKVYWVLATFLILSMTDWFDGKLAKWLNQGTTFGARLDSVADATMYSALLFASLWLKGPVLAAEWPWIAVALLTYACSCSASIAKFQALPSYHTLSAKASWLLMLAATLAIFLDGPIWAFRGAMLFVAAANLEAVLITVLLPHRRVNVISFRRALWIRRNESIEETQ